jgi:hypothetical protein
MLHLHAPLDGSTLGKKAYDMIFDALGRPSMAFVMWVAAGHEVRQEAKRPLLDLLDVLANPCPYDYGIVTAPASTDRLAFLRLAPPVEMLRKLRVEEQDKPDQQQQQQQHEGAGGMTDESGQQAAQDGGETATAITLQDTVVQADEPTQPAQATGALAAGGRGVALPTSGLPSVQKAPQVPPMDDVSRKLLQAASPTRHLPKPKQTEAAVSPLPAKPDETVALSPKASAVPRSPATSKAVAAETGAKQAIDLPGGERGPQDKAAAFAAQASLSLAQTGGELDVTQQARPSSAPGGVLDRYVRLTWLLVYVLGSSLPHSGAPFRGTTDTYTCISPDLSSALADVS